ncbi:MAG: TldD/PmbA family protein [Deltaproteobacteria bacterium]|nr:TldD/PmbA family protein [Deltaproteobacteria bacterium]
MPSPYTALLPAVDLPLDRVYDALNAQGADQWELFIKLQRERSLELRGGALEARSTCDSIGVGIRLIREGRLGLSYLSQLDPAAISAAAQAAYTTAVYNDRELCVGFVDTAPATQTSAVLFDPDLNDRRDEQRLATARAVDQLAKSAKVAHREVCYIETVTQVRLLNSHGVDVEKLCSLHGLSATIVAEGPRGEATGWYGLDRHRLADLDAREIGQRALRQARDQSQAEPIDAGHYVALFAPITAAELLEPLSALFSGEEIAKGRSPIGDKIGTEIASPALTLIDDGTLDAGSAAAAFDDEATAQQRTVLIDAGVMSNMLLDRLYAHRLGRLPTGNGCRAEHSAPISPQATNLFVAPGSADPLALISDVRRGIYITELLGAEAIDPETGDFSIGACGYLLENGRPGRAFRGVAIVGNLLTLMRGVQAVGNDLTFFGNYGAPSIRVEGLELIAGDGDAG